MAFFLFIKVGSGWLTLKCGKNISETLPYCLMCLLFFFLPHFDVHVICDLLLNRCMTTWFLFVELKHKWTFR